MTVGLKPHRYEYESRSEYEVWSSFGEMRLEIRGQR